MVMPALDRVRWSRPESDAAFSHRATDPVRCSAGAARCGAESFTLEIAAHVTLRE